MNRRREVWQRLTTNMRPKHLPTIASEITLRDLAEAFATLLDGSAHGRIVVKIA